MKMSQRLCQPFEHFGDHILFSFHQKPQRLPKWSPPRFQVNWESTPGAEASFTYIYCQ